jgi:PncC family amidohydrolase
MKGLSVPISRATVAEEVSRLAALGRTFAVAESCSGGLIAHRITDVPGASACFVGGIVAYSNDAKEALLGVSPEVLAECGAVSDPVARQMAEGVRDRMRADYGIGVTGIAGPDGGTEKKPVGLVYIAVADGSETVVTRNLFDGQRQQVKSQAADRALEMLGERIS